MVKKMSKSEKTEKGSESEMMDFLPDLVKVNLEAFPEEKRELLRRFQRFLNSGLNRVKNGRGFFLGNFFNLDTEKGTCGLTSFDGKGIRADEFIVVLIELFACMRKNFLGRKDLFDTLIVKALAISKAWEQEIERMY